MQKLNKNNLPEATKAYKKADKKGASQCTKSASVGSKEGQRYASLPTHVERLFKFFEPMTYDIQITMKQPSNCAQTHPLAKRKNAPEQKYTKIFY